MLKKIILEIKQTFKLDIFSKIMTKLGLKVAKDISKFLIPDVTFKKNILKKLVTRKDLYRYNKLGLQKLDAKSIETEGKTKEKQHKI